MLHFADPKPILRQLGITDYQATWRAMQNFTRQRGPETPDEIWLTEHRPVYTQGLNKKDAKLPLRDDIPLVETDRGGKITYHGPGQLMVYFLLDLQRAGCSMRQLVSSMEHAVIAMLAQYGVNAYADSQAPGVYVAGSKIASLGLRIKNGCCYHGLSLNVDMDLAPFAAIDPCGYPGLSLTQTCDLGIPDNLQALGRKLLGPSYFPASPTT